MTGGMKIRLDRTICDGFGVCARRAPEYFSLDDWGYASLVGDGTVADDDREAVMRAVLDCPVHAILQMNEAKPPDAPRSPTVVDTAEPEPITADNEAEWGFTR